MNRSDKYSRKFDNRSSTRTCIPLANVDDRLHKNVGSCNPRAGQAEEEDEEQEEVVCFSAIE
ncbi:hypothetical protein T11_11359 [Trichinella zimbabwensis]|uniref:Uncharacterized protein n=1 Tax=Trichinella zimbabwensis TaxID=268475 RepID=A0A0V1H2D5_9BILA|nr:hypothetical protein T11_11359 [Trichinella zimbabwensis]